MKKKKKKIHYACPRLPQKRQSVISRLLLGQEYVLYKATTWYQ